MGIDIIDLKQVGSDDLFLQNGLFTKAQWGNAKNIYLSSEQSYMLLSTNFGRKENNPVKQGRVITEYKRLCEVKHGGARPNNSALKFTQKDLASQLGISVNTLQNLKKLQDLIPELQDMVEQNELSSTVGYKIWARMPQEEQERFLNDIGREKIKALTQRETQQYID